MIRAWIAIALLAGSWLLGLGYYEPGRPLAWGVAVTIAAMLLTWQSLAVSQGGAGRLPFNLGPLEAILSLVLLLPAAWYAPWPFTIAPLAVIAGLALGGLPGRGRWSLAAAQGLAMTGLVLLAQGVVLALYASGTARSHDLPQSVVAWAARLLGLLGVDAAVDGPQLILPGMHQTHRLAVTWDLMVDPSSLLFLVGGLVLLGLLAAERGTVPFSLRRKLGQSPGRLLLVVLAWLPIRAALLVGLYIHRAATSDTDLPLHVMNQFLSPWVHLLLVAVPAVLAWRWVRCEGDSPIFAETKIGTVPEETPLRPVALAAGLVLAGAGLLAVGLQWDPIGPRLDGRVMFVERHSTWEPSDRPYDTSHFGGDDDDSISYTYTVAARDLEQFYAVSRLQESGKIDGPTLAKCDVLVIKVPTARFSTQEVDAVVQFVQRGGGLLLIGDHTNVEKSTTTMNDITRNFGFTFRDDLLFSSEANPDEQLFRQPRVPHPAIQHVPWFDFAVSCSIDPGFSSGRAVIQDSRLWSMPPEYHHANYMPYAQHCGEMRYGPFVQCWATRHGRGRVLAFSDSTSFSSFCHYQPGKAELLRNMVEWLNHGNTSFDATWLLTLVGLFVLPLAAWPLVSSRGWRAPGVWLVLVSAASGGWAVGSMVTVAIHRTSMPQPEPSRPLPQVVIDRTTSTVPLSKGAYNEDKQGRGYGLLEQWIPRLNYLTTRAAGTEALSGDALVVICPSRAADEEFYDRLVRYVAEGGRLLVVGSPDSDPAAANRLLRPFGLSIGDGQTGPGELIVDGCVKVQVEQAREVVGGRPIARLGVDRAVGAATQFGRGRVVAIGFGSLFNDAGMGNDWAQRPDAALRNRYEVLFALLRQVVEESP